MVRVSLGLHNTRQDIDMLVSALKKIAAGEYIGHYAQSETTGRYECVGARPDVASGSSSSNARVQR